MCEQSRPERSLYGVHQWAVDRGSNGESRAVWYSGAAVLDIGVNGFMLIDICTLKVYYLPFICGQLYYMGFWSFVWISIA